MWKLFFSFIIFLSASSNANAAEQCSAVFRTDLNARYEGVSKLNRADSKRRLEVTNLLNDIFSPIVRDFASAIRNLPDSAINSKAASNFEVSAFERNLPSPMAKYGFTRKYSLYLTASKSSQNRKALATEFNSEEMIKLFQVVNAVDHHLLNIFSKDASTVARFKDGAKILKAESFTERSDFHLSTSLHTVLQAITMLTADRVPGLSSTELINAVARQNGQRPSFVVQLALRLAPAVIGPSAGFYVPDPLVYRDGELSWSDNMKASFEAQRELKEINKKTSKEVHGMGCPVGRCQNDQSQPSLQLLLDALLDKAELAISDI